MSSVTRSLIVINQPVGHQLGSVLSRREDGTDSLEGHVDLEGGETGS